MKPVKPLKAPKQAAPSAPDRRPASPTSAEGVRTWKARHWAVILAAPLLLIVGGAVAYAKLTEHAPIVAVPDVVDRDVFSAAAAMQQSGFEFQAVFVDSPRPGGTILAQRPDQRAEARAGLDRHHAHREPTPRATVPDVTSWTSMAAARTLARRGLLNVTITPTTAATSIPAP